MLSHVPTSKGHDEAVNIVVDAGITIHPRALQICFLVWIVAGFSIKPFGFLLLLIISMGIGLLILRVMQRVLKTSLLTLVPLTIMLITLHVSAWYADPRGSILTSIYAAVTFSAHIAIVVFSSIMLFTAIPIDVTLNSLEDIGLPLSISYMLLSTIQLLPSMTSRVHAIRQSQEARGMTLRGSLPNRLKALVSLLGPLTLSLLELSEDKALVLEMKGYGKTKRTHITATRWRQRDWWWIIGSTTTAIAVVIVGA